MDHARVSVPREQAPREAADQLQAARVRVDRGRFRDRQRVTQPRDAAHELGRVRRPAADHAQLHPFTPVRATPG
jgi:hypothetical protein